MNLAGMTEDQLKVMATEYTLRGRAAATELERRKSRQAPKAPPPKPVAPKAGKKRASKKASKGAKKEQAESTKKGNEE